jgi:hypothetical protein
VELWVLLKSSSKIQLAREIRFSVKQDFQVAQLVTKSSIQVQQVAPKILEK